MREARFPGPGESQHTFENVSVMVVSPALDFGFLRFISMPPDPTLHPSSVHSCIPLSFRDPLPHPFPYPSLRLSAPYPYCLAYV